MNYNDHVEKMSGGGSMCRHCGGEVDDDGFAKHMGEGDTEGYEPEERQGNEPMETEQYDSGEDMRREGFIDAIKRRGAKKYAEGGTVAPDERMPSDMKPDDLMSGVKSDMQKNYEDEMKKKKQQKYGFGGAQ